VNARETRVPLHGRLQHLTAVGDQLSRVVAGNSERAGAVILVNGNSGVGKSAFANKVMENARDRGFDVYQTACEPFHEGMSYFPVRELVRQVAEGRPAGVVIAEMFGAGSSQAEMAAVSESVNADPASRREALVATFTNIILGRFHNPDARPVVLFIDDLEHLDAGSADALICLVSRLDEGKVVLLGGYRSDLVSTSAHPLKPVIASARRMEGVCTMLELKHFGENDFDLLVNALLAAPTDLPSKFYSKLFLETEGNPLFAREVLRMLRTPKIDGSPGPLSLISGTWKFSGDIAQWDIPDTVEEVIASRLDLLDTQQRQELETAAVVGRRFAFEVLSKLIEASEDDLLRDLERFLSVDIIRELNTNDEMFEFSHGKIGEVLYKSLSGLRKRRIHSQVAQVLAGMTRTANEDWDALIGEHLFLAARHVDGFPYLLRAARNAGAIGSAAQAAMLFRKALTASDGAVLSANDTRQSIQLELAGALIASSESGEAGDILEHLTGAGVPSQIRVRALNHLGDVLLFEGDVEQALGKYDQSRDLAESLGDLTALCEVMCGLAELHGRQYERKAGISPDEADSHRVAYVLNVNRAYELHRHVANGPLRARVLRNKAKLSRVSGDLAAAVSLYKESIGSTDNRVAEHRFLIPYAKTLRRAGKAEEALGIVDRVLAWSAQVSSRRSEAIAWQYRAMILMTIAKTPEDLEEAKNLGERAVRAHRGIGYVQGMHETQLMLGEIALRIGRKDDAVEQFRAASNQRDFSADQILEIAARELDANGEEDRAAVVRHAISQAPVEPAA